MERKLASLQKVLDVRPIPGADSIEVLTILGWKVVAKKGEFKIGDLVVYCEVDSILPERPEFEFLRKVHFRIKTIRLKGQVSQGIVFPISIITSNPDIWGTYDEGDDVTELLGITKYEIYIPAQLAGVTKGNFPDFLHKTDETRIQSVPDVLIRHKGKAFQITEKVDGSSFTCYYNNGEFGVCSRNLELKEDPNNAYWKVALELDLKGKLIALGGNHAIQGELVGQGIQCNKYKLDKVKLFIFNLFDIDRNRYYDALDFIQVIKEMNLETVPVIKTCHTLTETLEDLVTLSDAPSVLNKDTPREGIIFRSIYENIRDEELGRLSFKIVNPQFLIKYNE